MKKTNIKKLILFIVMNIFILSNAFSQSGYPRIETDSTGKKVVIMTYEQAQKVDYTFELAKLLEKRGTECDSVIISYIKVVDKLEKQVNLLEVDIKLYKDQIVDKDNQISNLKERLKNSESNTLNCDQQLSVKDDQINLLNKEVKTLKRKRNIAYASGIVGIISGILLVILIH